MGAPTYLAGIVHHDSPDDLLACLASLGQQTLPPAAVAIVDHGLAPDGIRMARERCPALQIVETPNEGYAGGANRIVAMAEALGCEFILLLNPDVVLDPDFATRLCDACIGDPRIAIASGKLLRPGRQLIDSAGISMGRTRRPRDRGAEEADLGQYDQAETVFAVCGAAMWLRCDALPALAIDGEVFDRDFVSYYEDTDLCWRAAILSRRVYYEPRATATHRRGWQQAQRFRVPIAMRRHSFKNRYLQLLKNERGRDFLINFPIFCVWETLRIAFALFRDRAIIGAYPAAFRSLRPMLRKRRALRQMRLAAGPR